MQRQKIELRQRRDIGDTISTFFDFFKQHLKPFINLFIKYNGIFILLFLGISYLMVTGFIGLIRSEYGYQANESDWDTMLFGFGILGFVAIFIITSLMNYSLAASYMTVYEKNPDQEVDGKDVWKMITNNLGKIIVFIILFILLYIPVIIISTIIGLIPVIGLFGQYIIALGYAAWMGVAFMNMLHENKDVTDGLGEGWRLIMKHFWKAILVNFVISFLLGVLMLLVLFIPGILIGIYAFHATETGVDLLESPVATVIWTIAFTILLILYTLLQAVTQLGNGVLYFSLHEEVYNLAARQRIDQIGAGE